MGEKALATAPNYEIRTILNVIFREQRACERKIEMRRRTKPNDE